MRILLVLLLAGSLGAMDDQKADKASALAKQEIDKTQEAERLVIEKRKQDEAALERFLGALDSGELAIVGGVLESKNTGH
jgi:hypothetical protein